MHNTCVWKTQLTRLWFRHDISWCGCCGFITDDIIFITCHHLKYCQYRKYWQHPAALCSMKFDYSCYTCPQKIDISVFDFWLIFRFINFVILHSFCVGWCEKCNFSHFKINMTCDLWKNSIYTFHCDCIYWLLYRLWVVVLKYRTKMSFLL